MTELESGGGAPVLRARASSIGAIRESLAGERRVAITPASAALLVKAGFDVMVEAGAGLEAGYPDAAYEESGARLVDQAEAMRADVLARVRATAWPDGVEPSEGAVVVGLADPLGRPEEVTALASSGVTLFALELLPRVTRAQPMDVLSSQATVAGYKAVLLAAEALPKMFPLLTTAAGTITPARVFVVGAGVAGLQAIATARRLGAVVEAYDVRPAVREEVGSLGARFLEIELDTGGGDGGSGSGAYAQELQEETLRKQRELMGNAVAGSDVVITTAQVPGRKAPVLVTAEMVDAMAAGSVVVDLACEQGGNCEVTRNGETVVTGGGVRVIGPANITSTVPTHASHLYARNVANFVQYVVADGELRVAGDDEIATGTLVCHGGEVTNSRVLDALGSEKASA